MKHITTFEDYNPVNEVTGAYVSKVASKPIAADSDELTKAIKNRQRTTLDYYINPELEKMAQRLGFNIAKVNDATFKVSKVGETSDGFWISTDGKIENLDTGTYDTVTLKKIKTLQRAIVQDYTAKNEL